jgi:hypothetical protein
MLAWLFWVGVNFINRQRPGGIVTAATISCAIAKQR